jgi:hypothetical protein
MMENRKFWVGMLVMALVFGMAVVGCDNGTDDNEETSTTWANGNYRLVISGTSYTFKQVQGGTLYDVSKGTFTTTDSGQFTINQTHQINTGTGQLEPASVTRTGTFSVTGNTMILGGFTAPFSDVNGTWTKQ